MDRSARSAGQPETSGTLPADLWSAPDENPLPAR